MVVKVFGLTVFYNGNSRPALEDVTVEFRKGEMVLLMGPNGAGKSTLIRAILGLVRPAAGRIEVLGTDPTRDRSVRRRIAYVPQARSLNVQAPLRVRDLVEMGALLSPRRPDHDGELARRIETALESVGLLDKINARIAHLSGGQLARALLARALAQDPEIYLLDEPFESIDTASEAAVLRALRSERERGKLVLVTEHHITDFSEFDRIVFLNRRVIASGRPDEVLSNRSVTDLLLAGHR
ncbi:MAG: metal ABC transporter ATP-binding protein [Nitrososphaerota archaeon]